MDNLRRETKCIGIDLGTTNTTIAVSRLDINGNIVLEDLEIRQKGNNNERNREKLPSILYRKADGREVVGFEAQDLKESTITNNSETLRFLDNTKRFIGQEKIWIIDDKKYTPIDAASLILRHTIDFSKAKTLIEDDSYVFITVPANFNTDQRNDTLEAARRAGLKKVELYDEPKAAILSFINQEINKRNEDKTLDVSTKKRILVIDIGGGTCDICVEDVHMEKDAFMFEHIAVGRDNLGGIDFDRRIAEELFKSFLKGVPDDPSSHLRLINIAQKAKESVSEYIDYCIYDEHQGNESKLYENQDWLKLLKDVDVWKAEAAFGNENDYIKFSLDAEGLYKAIKPLIFDNGLLSSNKDEREQNKNMEALIFNTLEENNVKKESIDVIFLTGGMSKCFPLKAALFQMIGKRIICPEEPFLAVSRGAALINKYPTFDSVSQDIMPRSIMMETESGFRTLIKAGEYIPVTKTVDEIFKTISRNGVVIRLFEGKSDLDSQLRRLNNTYTVDFDSPKELGREFIIKYTVDKTKRIKFIIEFLDDKKEIIIDAKIKEGK